MKHIISLLVTLCLFGCSNEVPTASTPAAAATLTPAATPTPQVGIVWGAAGRSETEDIRKALMGARFQEIVDRINRNLRLPQKLDVLFQDKDGPLYDRSQKAIFFSYDFVLQTQSDFLKHGYCETDEEASEAAVLTAEFVFLHEMTHALLDILDIPILASEEDVADGLAAVTAGTIMKEPEMALATAGSLHVLQKQGESIPEQQYWSRHSLDEQRFYRIVGLAYGSDPERVGPMIKKRHLTPDEWWKERAPGCEKDYQNLHRDWLRVLEPHRTEEFSGETP